MSKENKAEKMTKGKPSPASIAADLLCGLGMLSMSIFGFAAAFLGAGLFGVVGGILFGWFAVTGFIDTARGIIS